MSSNAYSLTDGPPWELCGEVNPAGDKMCTLKPGHVPERHDWENDEDEYEPAPGYDPYLIPGTCRAPSPSGCLCAFPPGHPPDDHSWSADTAAIARARAAHTPGQAAATAFAEFLDSRNVVVTYRLRHYPDTPAAASVVADAFEDAAIAASANLRAAAAAHGTDLDFAAQTRLAARLTEILAEARFVATPDYLGSRMRADAGLDYTARVADPAGLAGRITAALAREAGS